MLKLTDNPPILPPQVKSLRELTGPWWIGHTKSRCEKAFAWDLLRREVHYFLPLVERTTVSSGKKRRGMMPLFSSYVFFCGDENARYTALTTGHLCQVLRVVDGSRLIEELGAIETALLAGAPLDPYPNLEPGRRCRIKTGAFRGLEGIVIERHAKHRFVLFVSILQQGASLEIDADLLEPIEDEMKSLRPATIATGMESP